MSSQLIATSADKSVTLVGCIGFALLNLTQSVLFYLYLFQLLMIIISKPEIALSFFEVSWIDYFIKILALFGPVMSWLLIFVNGQYSLNISSRFKKVYSLGTLILTAMLLGFSFTIFIIYFCTCKPSSLFEKTVFEAVVYNQVNMTLVGTQNLNICPFISLTPFNATEPVILAKLITEHLLTTYPFFNSTKKSQNDLISYYSNSGGYITNQIDLNFIILFIVLCLLLFTCIWSGVMHMLMSKENEMSAINGISYPTEKKTRKLFKLQNQDNNLDNNIFRKQRYKYIPYSNLYTNNNNNIENEFYT